MITNRQKMQARRARIGSDTGFSVVEVLVAVVIFSLISVGVAQAMINAIRFSGDGQHRSVALNIAATEVDRLKALNNPYGISSTATGSPITSVIDGITYSLSRKVSWVNVNGNEISCSAASGTFQLLRVKVSVDWGGRMAGSNPASVSTTISPQNTILSPTTATLFISVTKSDGTPYAGVQPTVLSPSGTSLAVPATNTDGCSYLSGIGAGNYTVSVSATNGISSAQTTTAAANPTPTVVTAGSAVSVPFSYDQSATLAPLAYGTAGTIAPSDLITSYSSTTSTAPYYVSGSPTSLALFPVSSGYSVVAGKLIAATTGASPYTGCLSPDPVNWTAATVAGTALRAGADPANAAASPGGTAAYTVPMGAARVTVPSGGTIKLASATATVAGDPGCAQVTAGTPTQTYTYSLPVAGTYLLATPYGAWSSTFTNALGGPFPINATPVNAYSTSASSTFTVDPRTP